MQYGLVVLLFALPSLSFACGPESCSFEAPCLTYAGNVGVEERPDYSWGCREGLPHLDPENYTQQNIALFLQEYFGVKEDQDKQYASQGDICQGNSPKAQQLFSAWVNEQPWKKETKDALTSVRQALLAARCIEGAETTSQTLLARVDATPAEARESELATYLRGAIHLYARQYAEAAKFFAALRTAQDKRLRELSPYLEGRVALLQATEKWDGYGLDSQETPIDRNKIAEGKTQLEKYLRDFPQGAYAASAQGLLRRAAHLVGDKEKYRSLLNAVLDSAAAQGDIPRLTSALEEYDTVLAPYDMQEAPHIHPFLWLVRSYLVQRQWLKYTAETTFAPAEELTKLAQEKSAFAPYPGLYSLTRANLLLATKRYADALAELPPQKISAHRSWGLSWGILKARILVGLRKFTEARAVMRPFLPTHPTVRAFHTYLFLWEGKTALAFAPAEEKATDEAVLDLFARRALTTTQLLELVRSGPVAKGLRPKLEALLAQRLLFQRRFADLHDILPKLAPATLPPKVRTAVVELAKGPQPAALLGIADYLRNLPHLAPDYQSCERIAPEEKANSWPIDFYRDVVEAFPKGQNHLVQAEALHEALHCFSSLGSSHCYDNGATSSEKEEEQNRNGWVTPATRKAWFKLLHSKYKNTKFARRTPIFW